MIKSANKLKIIVDIFIKALPSAITSISNLKFYILLNLIKILHN